MAGTNSIVDGSQQYGTGSDVVFTNPDASTVTATLNSIVITRPLQKAKQYGATGLPTKQRWTADVAELSCEAQFQTSSTLPIIEGATFSYTADATHGSELWVVVDAPRELSNDAGAIRVMPIKAEKLINGAPTVT